MYVAAKSVSVRECLFEGNSSFGAHVTGEGVRATFDECSFVGNLIAGLSGLENSFVTVKKCHFKQNEKFGAQFTNAKAALTGCDFVSNKGIGLDARGAAAPSLDSCVFESNGSFGAQISGARTGASFTECRFLKNTGSSAVIVFNKAVTGFIRCAFHENGCFHAEIREEGRARFDQCELSESSGGIGMFIHTDSICEIEGGQLKKEGKCALYAGIRSQVVVQNAEILGCGQCGLLFDSQSSGIVRGSKIKYNTNAGIQAEGGDIRVEANEIEGHLYYGIHSKSGATVAQEKNSFKGNEKGDVQLA
jgi:hypothetical protein